MQQEGIEQLGFGGWSFGGAVAIQAGVIAAARTVVTFATQGYGAEVVGQLPEDSSVLLIHGDRDQTLTPYNSELVYKLAHEPKELFIFKGAGHGLDEASEEVRHLCLEWINSSLPLP